MVHYRFHITLWQSVVGYIIMYPTTVLCGIYSVAWHIIMYNSTLWLSESCVVHYYEAGTIQHTECCLVLAVCG